MGLEVKDILISEIFADKDFNCRGQVQIMDCMGLAKEIEANGQLHPILIQPYTNSEHPEYKWQIVEGFRRYYAIRINKQDTIRASLSPPLSREQAEIINYTENLHRADLTFAQEARALNRFGVGRVDDGEIARKLNVSRTWVTPRREFLALPGPIQREIEIGTIPQGQISELYKIPTDEERYEAVRKYKEAKFRGMKAKVQSQATKKKAPHQKRARNRPECLEMQTHIREAFRLQGDDIDEITSYLRALAWCAGVITDTDIYVDLQKIAQRHGKRYSIPEEVYAILQTTV